MSTLNLSTESPEVLTIGRCIYCSKYNTDELSREHVLPYGLGGGLILLEASCPQHRKVTGDVEAVALGPHSGLGAFRHRFGASSSKKREKIPLLIDFGTHTERREVHPSEHPGVLFIPELAEMPGLLDTPQRRQNHRVKMGKMLTVADEKAAPRLLAQSAGKRPIALSQPFNFWAFTRMLAKIAHGIAIAEEGFTFRPLLLGIIGGYPPAIEQSGVLIGSCIEQPQHLQWGDREGHGHAYTFRSYEGERSKLWVVSIRLFSSFHCPMYSLIAGVAQDGVATGWEGPTNLTETLGSKRSAKRADVG